MPINLAPDASKRFTLAIPLFLGFIIVSCSSQAPAPKTDAPDRARTVAQEFVDGYYHQFPEEACEVSYPDTPMDRPGDRSATAITAWRAREDAWLERFSIACSSYRRAWL